MRFVHGTCLDQWRLLNVGREGSIKCQLCMSNFKLVPASAFSAEGIGRLVQNKRVYNAFLKGLSISSLLPLSCGAILLLKTLHRDDVFVSGPMDQDLKPWRKRVFGGLLSANTLAQINGLFQGTPLSEASWKTILILGLTKLGSYGCTIWLFTGGLGEVLPTRRRDIEGQARVSPVLAIFRAIIEFYIIPIGLRTPRTRKQLPGFCATTLIGLWFLTRQVEARLRSGFSTLVPLCRRLELGTLASN